MIKIHLDRLLLPALLCTLWAGNCTAQSLPLLGTNLEVAEFFFVVDFLPEDVQPAITALDNPNAPPSVPRGYAVTWLQADPEQSSTERVWVAIVDADGRLTAGPTAIAVEEDGLGFGHPAIASDGRRLFSVVWPVYDRILALRHEQRLVSRSFHGTANSQTGAICPLDGLAAEPQGGSWSLDDILLMDPNKLDSLVTQSGNPFIVDAPPTRMDLAATPQGRFAIAFQDERASGNWGVYLAGTELVATGLGGNPVDGCPSGLGTLLPLDDRPEVFGPIEVTANAEYRVTPRIDINPNNQNTVVTWRNRFGELLAQRFIGTGTPVGSRILIAERSDRTRVTNHDPVAAFDPQGRIWIAWEQNQHENPDGRARSTVLASKFDSDGNVLLEKHPVSTAEPPLDSLLMLPKRGVDFLARDLAGNLAASWRQDANACGQRLADLDFGNPFSFCPGPTIDADAETCSVKLSFLGSTYSNCRVGLRIDPTNDGEDVSWVRLGEDRAFEWTFSPPGTLSTTVRFEENPSFINNRCAWLNNYGTSANRLLLVQKCSTPDQCEPCDAEQREQTKALPTITDSSPPPGPPAPTTKAPAGTLPDGAFGFQSDIYLRWLQDDFDTADATLVPQVKINDQPVDPIRQRGLPALGMNRSGELITAWLEWEATLVSKLWTQSAEGPVELSINDIGILEGELGRATATFTLSANKPYPRVIGDANCPPAPSVSLLTADDTASTLTGDYELTGGVLGFAYGDDGFGNPCGMEPPAARSFSVPVTNDEVYEDTETFLVDLFSEQNAIVVKRQGIGVIVDNDPPAMVSFPTTTIEICEDGSLPQPDQPRCPPGNPNPRDFVELMVMLDMIQEVEGSVEFQTMDGVDQGDTVGAVSGTDYEGVVGEVQFLARNNSAFLSIDLINNDFTEPTKRFQVELIDSVDLTLGDSTLATVLILNDDDCVTPPAVHLPDPGQFAPANLPSSGSDTERQGYLCVENISDNNMDGSIDGCPWQSQLLDGDGQGPFLNLQDFAAGHPETAALVDAHCSLRPETITGVIRYSAPPNTPVDSGNATATRSDDIRFVDGSANPPAIQIVQNGSSACTPNTDPTSFAFLPVGGEGQFSVSFADTEACSATAWSVVVQGGNGWLHLDSVDGSSSATSGAGAGIVQFSVDPVSFEGPDRQAQITIGNTPVAVIQEGAFHDHFEDATPPDQALWHYNDPAAWAEAGTHLTGSSAGPLTLIADPAFAGCSRCSLRTSMRIDSFDKGLAIVYMWYRSPNEFLALSADEFANRWTLVQRVGGTDHILRELTSDILVGEEYPVTLGFDLEAGDGPLITATVGGLAMCPESGTGGSACLPWDPDPTDPQVDPVIGSGVVGLGVEATTASFNRLSVIRADRLEVPLGTVFLDGFESD